MEEQPTRGDAPARERSVTVREVMTREYVGVSDSDTVSGTADLLLAESANVAVVLYGTDPVGVVTASDALEHLNGDGADDEPVASAMSEEPPTVAPDEDLFEAAGEMADADVDCLLVTDGDEVVGLVTNRDVVDATASLVNHAVREPAPTHAETARGEGDDYSTQSVCEVCGSLTPELRDVNGQLVCENCRGV